MEDVTVNQIPNTPSGKSKVRRSSSLSDLDECNTPGTNRKPLKPRKRNKAFDSNPTKQLNLDAWKQKFDSTESIDDEVNTDTGPINNSPLNSPTMNIGTFSASLESDKKLDSILDRMDAITKQLTNVVTVQDLDIRLDKATRSLKEDTEAMRSEIFDLRNENDKLNARVISLERIVSNNTDSIGLAHFKVDLTTDTLNDLEQHGRLNTVRMYGIDDRNKFEDNTTSADLALKLINDKLGIDIDDSEICIAHRLGKWGPTQPRGIIVKFVRRSVKMEVMKNSKVLIGSKYNIKEDVTNTNRELMKKLRSREDTKSVWSSNGKVYAEMNDKKVRNFESDIKTRLNNQQRFLNNNTKAPHPTNFVNRGPPSTNTYRFPTPGPPFPTTPTRPPLYNQHYSK